MTQTEALAGRTFQTQNFDKCSIATAALALIVALAAPEPKCVDNVSLPQRNPVRVDCGGTLDQTGSGPLSRIGSGPGANRVGSWE